MIEKLSTQDYLKLYHDIKPKRNKYGSKKVECDGFVFDSMKEYKQYLILKKQQELGYISDLEIHPVYKFPIVNDKGTPVKYIPDFRYHDRLTISTVVVDVKGVKTPEYKLKKAMMRYFFKIEVVEV